MITLSGLKAQLGISDASEDAQLTRWLRQAIGLVRRVGRRYFCGAIESNSVAANTVVTSHGHQLATGATIVVSGSNCNPTIDGERVITRLGPDSFSIPVNVAQAGSAGFFAVKRTEFYAGNDSRAIVLRERPVQSVESVCVDSAAVYGQAAGAFAADTQLTAGADYGLAVGEAGLCESGVLYRVNAVWPGVNTVSAGLLAQGISEGIGNIKVTYVAGWKETPPEIELLVCQLAAELRSIGDKGGPLASESFDYYSYNRASAVDQAALPLSTRRLLGSIRPVSI